MKESLYDILTDDKRDLSEDQAKALYTLLSSGSWKRTRADLYERIVTLRCKYVRPCGFLRRFELWTDDKGTHCQYYAGQDYPSELAFIRNYIRGKAS